MNIDQQIQQLLEQKKKEEEDKLFLENAKQLLEGKYFLDTGELYSWQSKMVCFRIFYVEAITKVTKDGLDIKGPSLSVFVNSPVIRRNYNGVAPYFGNIDMSVNKFNTVFTGYQRDKTNIKLSSTCRELTGDEFKVFISNLVDIQNTIFNKITELVDIKPTTATDSIPLSFPELLNFHQIDTYLKENPSVQLKDLTGKFKKILVNRFNENFKLQDLTQYDLSGGNGLYLKIVGGDGGTDYEPYITHYYLDRVVVKWEEILYPIRLQLNCKVFELVEKLEKIENVYNPAFWKVRYFGSYDVTFQEASLYDNVIEEINSVISKHLK